MSTAQSYLDPYKNSRFHVKWDGRYVAGISRVSGLKRSTAVVSHREGGIRPSAASRPARLNTRRSPWNAASLKIPLSRNGRNRSRA